MFGFNLTKEKTSKNKEDNTNSFIPDIEKLQDGEEIEAFPSRFGHVKHVINLDSNYSNTKNLIKTCRNISCYPEVDEAIRHIVTAAISRDENRNILNLNVDGLKNNKTSQQTIDKIFEEFNNILSIVDFNDRASYLFRKFYIDGKLLFHIIVDNKKLTEGIQDVRMLDPINVKKINEVEKTKDPETGTTVKKYIRTLYFYESDEIYYQNSKIALEEDSIVEAKSGVLDKEHKNNVSNLYKAIKPANNLRMLEDSLVVYRVSRAPERRIFYIDVGNLPSRKADEYVKDVMNKHRNDIKYNVHTGEIENSEKHTSMLEDFFLPRKEGSRGTEIDTLQGGENLGEIEDVNYFQRKLYRALNIPETRIQSDTAFSIGFASEISRDEIIFQKFIDQQRNEFGKFLLKLLKTQLLLKKVINQEDWNNIRNNIYINFNSDSHFTELKHNELLKERFGMLRDVEDAVGKYVSNIWVRKNILKQSEEEIKQLDKEIKSEGSDKDDDDSGGFGF